MMQGLDLEKKVLEDTKVSSRIQTKSLTIAIRMYLQLEEVYFMNGQANKTLLKNLASLVQELKIYEEPKSQYFHNTIEEQMQSLETYRTNIAFNNILDEISRNLKKVESAMRKEVQAA